MEEKTVLVVVRYEIELAKHNAIVHDDETFVELNKEQYDRIKASYETKRFNRMNEDENLADVCRHIQIILADYPEDIKENWSFEEILKGLENPIPIDVILGFCENFTQEELDAIEADAEQAYAEVEAEFERKKNDNGIV